MGAGVYFTATAGNFPQEIRVFGPLKCYLRQNGAAGRDHCVQRRSSLVEIFCHLRPIDRNSTDGACAATV